MKRRLISALLIGGLVTGLLGIKYSATDVCAAEQTKYFTELTEVKIEGITYEYVPSVCDFEDEDDDGRGNYYKVTKFTQEYINDEPRYTDVAIQNEIDGICVEMVEASAFAQHSEIKSVFIGGVTRIGKFAFQGCTGLEEIKFEGPLDTIYDFAFQGCTSLKKVKFQGGIDEVGAYAFEGCTGLKSLSFEDVVWSIKENAFANCIELESIEIKNNPHNTIVGKNAFCNTATTNEAHKEGKPTIIKNKVLLEGEAVKGDLELSGDEVRVIMPYAFAENKTVKKITLDGIKRIGTSAFSQSSITKIKIRNVKAIGRCAFEKCEALKQVAILGTRFISYGLFSGCTRLKKVTLEGTRKIAIDVFKECKNLTTLNICSDEKLLWEKKGTNKHRNLDDCSRLKRINLKTKGISKSIRYAEISKKVKLNVPNKKKRAYRKYVICKVV